MRSPLREQQQKEVNLGLFSADTIALMLEMLHHHSTESEGLNNCNTTYRNDIGLCKVKELLQLIDFLDIQCLVPVCCELLNSLMQNCCGSQTLREIWEIVQTYDLDTVENTLLFFIAKNMKKFQMTGDFFVQELPVKLFSKLMLQENLDVGSETEVMFIMEMWINYSRDERLVHTDDLLWCVHIPSLKRSECGEIEKIICSLKGKRMDMKTSYSKYIHNPHQFFKEFPHTRRTRSGINVILTIGGIHEDSFRMYQLYANDTHQNANPKIGFPMFYSEISDKLKSCAILENKDRRKNDAVGKRQRKYNKCYDNYGNSFVRMSQFSSAISQGQLVEFGSCVYEGFVYILGGQTQMNDEGNFSVRTVQRLDPNSCKWQEVSLI